MKIIENKHNEFRFDNGAWVRIILKEDSEDGSWEFQSDEDDEETYSEGCLLFENKELIDYDGCYELPKEVEMAVNELGYKVVDLEN